MQTADLPKATVRFNSSSVSLYLMPEGEEIRARYLVLTLPRTGEGEDCPNVRYLRAIERAANEAREVEQIA